MIFITTHTDTSLISVIIEYFCFDVKPKWALKVRLEARSSMLVHSESVVRSQLLRSLVPENEAVPIRQTVYFQTNSVWPAASHTFQYFQTGFQKRESKGSGVVKT